MKTTKTVLIVDDNPACVEKNRILLSQNGFDCHKATDGLVAFKKICQFLNEDRIFDLILMDIKMPLMDGMVVVETIREVEKLKGIKYGNGSKIIMATAESSNQTIFSSFKKGCEAYLIKPFGKKELFEKINEIFNQELIPA